MSTAKAVVIGSGFAGLASAVRLRMKGYDVTVLEKNPDAGGRARRFVKDGLNFDAGPTVITAPYLLEELFTLARRDYRDYFQLVPVDPFYRVNFTDGKEFDFVGDEERLLAQIAQFNPQDVEGYKKLYAHASEIFDIGYTRLADQPFFSIGDMMRVLPDMLRLQNYRSAYGLVAKYLKSPHLRQVFTFEPLLVGGNPFTTSSIYLLIHVLERKWGVHFAKGGTYSIIQGLCRLLEELGVGVHFNAEVENIEVKNGAVEAVRCKGGARFPAQVVVANSDPTHTYLNLLDAQHLRYNTPRSVRRKKQSMSLFVAYFATNVEYPNLAHHTIVLGQRYRELLRDIFTDYHLSNDFSLYLHAPKRTDRTMYPDGVDGFYVLSPVPNKLSGVNWQEEGPVYMEKVLDHLSERLMPKLQENLRTQFYITPDYFEKVLNSPQGTAFSIEPLLTQSAYFRYHNRSQDVGGLYFVGAGTHPGAGIPGVLNSARLVDNLIGGVGPSPARGQEHHGELSL